MVAVLFTKSFHLSCFCQILVKELNYFVEKWHGFLQCICRCFIRLIFGQMSISRFDDLAGKLFGLCNFTTHDPTIPDPTMHDSCINYANQFNLCWKNYKHYATRATFCWTKDRELLLLMKINNSPHHVEFSGVFLKLITIYIVTESLVFITLQLFT